MVWAGAVIPQHRERAVQWVHEAMAGIVAGGAAGLVANALTHPIDSIKAHEQFLAVRALAPSFLAASPRRPECSCAVPCSSYSASEGSVW